MIIDFVYLFIRQEINN